MYNLVTVSLKQEVARSMAFQIVQLVYFVPVHQIDKSSYRLVLICLDSDLEYFVGEFLCLDQFPDCERGKEKLLLQPRRGHLGPAQLRLPFVQCFRKARKVIFPRNRIPNHMNMPKKRIAGHADENAKSPANRASSAPIAC